METEFLQIDKRNAWGTVFQEIKNESNNYDHVIKDAKKIENKNLNRYRDVNPFDHSRVKLQRGNRDYINASLVNVPSADRKYILTQGPLPVTTGHFWLMVWEQNSRAILMLNRVIEKNTIKCHQYWPIGTQYGGEDEILLTDVNLKVMFQCQNEESHYILREFLITDLENQESRKVLQFHYTTWPDFGVPESPAAFLNFLFAVRDSGALNSNIGPPVVHCSAGIGRSGTFCLVDSCLVLIEKNNDPNCVNIRQQLLEMRHYRMGLIQTPDQLRFSYLAIIEGAKLILPKEFQNVPLQNSDLQDNSWKQDNDASPPPLPPRSTHGSDDMSPSSIKQISNMFSQCNGELSAEDNTPTPSSNEKEVENSERLPPCNSPEKSVSNEAESSSQLRKRARKEREEKTAALVQNIKKKQKESERWEKRRSFIKISLGLVLIIGFGYFVYKNYSKS